MTKSLMELMLDHSFEWENDPGPYSLSAENLESDLKEVGLVTLNPREVTHIRSVIKKHSNLGVLTYDQVVNYLLDEDFVLEQKVRLEDKLAQRQRDKERKAKEKLRQVHQNHEGVSALERRIADYAVRRLSSPVPIGKATQDDLEIVFVVEKRLRQVLDKKRARLVDIFKELDSQGTGKVTKVELGKGLARVGVPLSRGDLEKFFRIVDYDSSGFVEFKEFSKVLQSANLKRQQEKMARAQSPAAIVIPLKGSNNNKSNTSSKRTHSNKDRAYSHVTFQFTDREFLLPIQLLEEQHPDSVLVQAVHQAEMNVSHQDKLCIYLDMNPDIFEQVYNTTIGLMMTRPWVNGETMQNMRDILKLSKNVMEEENVTSPAPCSPCEQPQGPLACANCATNKNKKRNKGPLPGHHFQIPITKAISSEIQGIDIHVRKNESLLVDSISGTGQLMMDVYIGDENPVVKCKAVTVFDSKAFFHHVNATEPIHIQQKYPGNARYRFYVVSNEVDKHQTLITTLTVNFVIITGFTCTCAANESESTTNQR